MIPQLSLVMGPCAGGAVYSPALTDFTFMVGMAASPPRGKPHCTTWPEAPQAGPVRGSCYWGKARCQQRLPLLLPVGTAAVPA